MHSSIYLCTFKFVLWIIVTCSFFESGVPVCFVNRRTSSNCVNMKIQSAACPSLRLTPSDLHPSPRRCFKKCRTSWLSLVLLPLLLPTSVTAHSHHARRLRHHLCWPVVNTWIVFWFAGESSTHCDVYLCFFGVCIYTPISLACRHCCFHTCECSLFWWKDFWLSADRIAGVFYVRAKRCSVDCSEWPPSRCSSWRKRPPSFTRFFSALHLASVDTHSHTSLSDLF